MNTIKLSKLLLVALLASSAGTMLVMNSGCVVAAAGVAGAGTVAYVEGKFIAHMDTPYRKVLHAVQVSIPQAGLVLVESQVDSLEAEFTTRTATDKKVVIEVTRESDDLAKLEIRVGTFGDRAQSQMIYDQIKTNL